MNFLEGLLKEKTEGLETELLYSQWIYNKKVYSEKLNNVKDYYSHYTDHGVNHSQTIINNIVRVLGRESLKNLSATDIWLILEAVYSHDCGMYLTLKDAGEIVKKKGIFRVF